MKRLFSRLSKKGLLIAALVVGAFGITAAAGAWSPDRQVYTVNNPADHVTFNSIVDNPDYGDERTFFDAKDATNTSEGGFVDKVNVKDGEEVLLRVYVHNNAATSLNGTNFDGPGVAHDAKLRIWLPTDTATALRANAYVSASNANPGEVADTVDFAGTDQFSVSYVPGSAIMYTNAVPSGFALSDSVVAGGAPIGYTGANGTIPGCFQYTGIVTIKVKVHTPGYSLEKKVRLNGTDTFTKSVTAQPGQKVDYVLAFKNTGSTDLKNVVLGDQLPKGVTYNTDTTEYYSSATDGKWVPSPSNNVTVGGVNIGTFASGGNAYLRFTATLPDAKNLKCGANELVNTGFAKPEGFTTIDDTATVTVNKECNEEKTPVYTCDAFTLTKGDNRTVNAKVTKYTATNGATLKTVTYDFGDKTTPFTTNDFNKTVTHNYAKDGDYNVTTKLLFSVNGQDKFVTSGNCAGKVSFTTPPVTPPTTPPETPSELPSTGPGEVVGLFAGVTILGALAHRLFLSRRLARS